MNVYCTECGEAFTPVEHREQPVGAEEPCFCSNRCETIHDDREEFGELYRIERYQGGNVFPS